MQDKVLVDIQTIENEVGDILLLCSDGLNGMLTDDEIKNVIESNRDDLNVAAKALIDAANANGGDDNITVVLVEVVEE
jgi:protein phosphatase